MVRFCLKKFVSGNSSNETKAVNRNQTRSIAHESWRNDTDKGFKDILKLVAGLSTVTAVLIAKMNCTLMFERICL